MSEPLTVSGLNQYVRTMLERDRTLSDLWVSGEISSFKAHVSGHFYFSIKDDKAQVSCVMFRGQNRTLKFRPENGMQVIVRCRASLFERSGSFQLYVTEMEPRGVGDLHKAFEQLKEQLQKEGLFDAQRKQPLPMLPSRIGVVTSASGAVIRDILNVLNRRFPDFSLLLFPVPVQGPDAAPSIARAIQYMDRHALADVLIVGRGGGSMEDLWAFNEEVVARAIAGCAIPVVSAVGHETDFTIADFAADVRAPTPSAAAELVLPQKSDLIQRIGDLNGRMRRTLLARTDAARRQLDRLVKARVLVDPMDLIQRRQMAVDMLTQRMRAAEKHRVTEVDRRLSRLCGALDALSPLKVLARGYGMVTGPEDGRPIRSVLRIRQGDPVRVTLSDGTLDCRVQQIRVQPVEKEFTS